MKRLKFALPVLLLLFFINCKTNKQAIYEKRFKEAYIYGFKMAYFKHLLLEGFNKSNEIKIVLSKDASKGMADMPVTSTDFELIDSCVKIDNIQMVKDSIRNIKRAEGAQGKYIFSYALEKFNGKWLDSLARARYKIYKNPESR